MALTHESIVVTNMNVSGMYWMPTSVLALPTANHALRYVCSPIFTNAQNVHQLAGYFRTPQCIIDLHRGKSCFEIAQLFAEDFIYRGCPSYDKSYLNAGAIIDPYYQWFMY